MATPEVLAAILVTLVAIPEALVATPEVLAEILVTLVAIPEALVATPEVLAAIVILVAGLRSTTKSVTLVVVFKVPLTETSPEPAETVVPLALTV